MARRFLLTMFFQFFTLIYDRGLTLNLIQKDIRCPTKASIEGMN